MINKEEEEESRGRGMPKSLFREDVNEFGINEGIMMDEEMWKAKIIVADHATSV